MKRLSRISGSTGSLPENLLLAVLLAGVVAVRLAGAFGDLWFDEIWSLSFARELVWPWEVLTRIHHDNNHPLNTMALYLTVRVVGAHAASIAYRMLSLITGVATVPLLFWVESQSPDAHSHIRARFTAFLTGVSFLAVVYSSEARGYAPVAFFSVTAFALVRHYSVESTRNGRLAFAAVAVLGILSHLTFLFVYAGLVTWTFVRAGARNGRVNWRNWIALHMFPTAFIIGYYVVDLRTLSYGGGPPFQMADVIGRTLSLAVNGPDVGTLRLIAGIAAACAFVCGVIDLRRNNNAEYVFFVIALVVAPAAVLVGYHARFLDTRYFFVLMPFLWMLASRSLTILWKTGVTGTIIATIVVALSVTGSITHLVPFLRYHRGSYADAVATIMSHTDQESIAVSSDNDIRNGMLLEYYSEVFKPGRKLIYVPLESWRDESPEWAITHYFGYRRSGNDPPVVITGPNGLQYNLVRSFPYGGVSGWGWYLYRTSGRVRPLLR